MAYIANYQHPVRLDTAVQLLIPMRVQKNGVWSNVYPETGPRLFCEFKTFGGSESIENGVLSVIDTATVKCWYDPRVKTGSRIKLEDGKEYAVVGDPEDVNQRHQYMQFRVERVGGGA